MAAAISQVAIITSWSDSKAGSLANILMLVAAGYGYTTRGDPRA